MPRHKIISVPSLPLPEIKTDNPNPFYNGAWASPRISERQRKVFAKDNWQCRVCESRQRLTVDHIIPVSRGGKNNPENLQTLCSYCNTEKGNMMPTTWVKMLKAKGIEFSIVRAVIIHKKTFMSEWIDNLNSFQPGITLKLKLIIANKKGQHLPGGMSWPLHQLKTRN